MSNVIQIDNPRVVFMQDEMDLELLEKAINKYRAKQPVYHKLDQTDEDKENDIVWWFLSGNTEFERGRSRFNNEVGPLELLLIDFGMGRSAHTVRDFRQTVKYLNKFMLKDKIVVFTVRDEYDSFKSIAQWHVLFSPNGEWSANV